MTNKQTMGEKTTISDFLMVFFFAALLNIPGGGEIGFLALSLLGLKYLLNKSHQNAFHGTIGFFICLSSIFWLKSITLLWTINKNSTINDLGTHIHFALAPLVFLAFYKTKNPLQLLISSLKLSAALLTGWIIFYWTRWEFFGIEIGRIEAGAQNAGVFGQIAGILSSWALILAIHSKDRVLFFAFFIHLFAVYLAGGRSHWMATTVITVILLYRALSLKHKYTLHILIVATLFVITTLPTMSKKIEIAYQESIAFFEALHQYQSKSTSTDILEQSASTSVGNRMALYVTAAKAWPQSPWIGFGAGTSMSVIDQYGDIKSEKLVSGHWHQQYIQFLMEFGLIGLSVLLLCIYRMHHWIKNNDKNLTPAKALFLSLIAYIAIIGFFTGSLQQGLLNTHVAASLALCAAIVKRNQNSQNTPSIHKTQNSMDTRH